MGPTLASTILLTDIALPSLDIALPFRIALIIVGIVCFILFIATMLMSNRSKAAVPRKTMVLQIAGARTPTAAATGVDLDESVSATAIDDAAPISQSDHMTVRELLSNFGPSHSVSAGATAVAEPPEPPHVEEPVLHETLTIAAGAQPTHAYERVPRENFERSRYDVEPSKRPSIRSIPELVSMLFARLRSRKAREHDNAEFDDGLDAQLAAAATETAAALETQPWQHQSARGSFADFSQPSETARSCEGSPTSTPAVAFTGGAPSKGQTLVVATLPADAITTADPGSDFGLTARSRVDDVSSQRPVAPMEAPKRRPHTDADVVWADTIDISFDEPSFKDAHHDLGTQAMGSEADDVDIDFDDPDAVAADTAEGISAADLATRSTPSFVAEPPIREILSPTVFVGASSGHDAESTLAGACEHGEIQAKCASAAEITSAQELDVDAVIAQLAREEQSGTFVAEREHQRIAEEALKAAQAQEMIQAVTWTRRYLGDESPTMDHFERLRFVRVLRDLDDFDVAGKTIYEGLTEETHPDVVVAMYEALVDVYNHEILMPAHQIFLDDQDPRMREIAARGIADLERVPTE